MNDNERSGIPVNLMLQSILKKHIQINVSTFFKCLINKYIFCLLFAHYNYVILLLKNKHLFIM